MKTLYNIYTPRNVRDYRNLTSMLALPIVLMLILGSALAGTFQIESIDPVKVVLVNENEGDLLQNLKQFLQQKSIKEIVDTETVEYLDQGMEKIKSGEAFALIYLEGSNGGKSMYIKEMKAC